LRRRGVIHAVTGAPETGTKDAGIPDLVVRRRCELRNTPRCIDDRPRRGLWLSWLPLRICVRTCAIRRVGAKANIASGAAGSRKSVKIGVISRYAKADRPKLIEPRRLTGSLWPRYSGAARKSNTLTVRRAAGGPASPSRLAFCDPYR